MALADQDKAYAEVEELRARAALWRALLALVEKATRELGKERGGG